MQLYVYYRLLLLPEVEHDPRLLISCADDLMNNGFVVVFAGDNIIFEHHEVLGGIMESREYCGIVEILFRPPMHSLS